MAQSCHEQQMEDLCLSPGIDLFLFEKQIFQRRDKDFPSTGSLSTWLQCQSRSFWVSHVGARAQASSAAFPGHKWGTGWEVEPQVDILCKIFTSHGSFCKMGSELCVARCHSPVLEHEGDRAPIMLTNLFIVFLSEKKLVNTLSKARGPAHLEANVFTAMLTQMGGWQSPRSRGNSSALKAP